MFGSIHGNEIITCSKHNYTGVNQRCPDCENERRAGGIASYYTSPLALRKEYEKEIGYNVDRVINNADETLMGILIHYVRYIERKLVRQAGE
jgi:hypothetical protein